MDDTSMICDITVDHTNNGQIFDDKLFKEGDFGGTLQFPELSTLDQDARRPYNKTNFANL